MGWMGRRCQLHIRHTLKDFYNSLFSREHQQLHWSWVQWLRQGRQTSVGHLQECSLVGCRGGSCDAEVGHVMQRWVM